MISSVLLFTHALVYKELDLPGINGGPGFKKNNDAYSDDVGIWAGAMGYGRQQHTILWCNSQPNLGKSTGYNCSIYSMSKICDPNPGTNHCGRYLVIDYEYMYEIKLIDAK